jgi:hypothetical protein
VGAGEAVGAKSVSESDVKSLNLAAGLSELMYNRIPHEDPLYEGASKGFVGVAAAVAPNQAVADCDERARRNRLHGC